MLAQFKNVIGLVNLQFAVLFQFTYNDEQYEKIAEDENGGLKV